METSCKPNSQGGKLDMTDVYMGEWSTEKWDKEMERMCKCGHPLRHHAFTMHSDGQGGTVLWTSQCCFCPIYLENSKFACEKFNPV